MDHLFGTIVGVALVVAYIYFARKRWLNMSPEERELELARRRERKLEDRIRRLERDR